MLNHRLAPTRQLFAERKQQRRAESQPGQHAHEGLCRRLQKQHRSGYASDQARGQERDHHAPWNVKLVAVGATAGSCSRPESDCIRGVRGNRRHAGKQQRGKRDEAAASGHGIQGSAQRSSEKEKDDGFESQVARCTRNICKPPRAHIAPSGASKRHKLCEISAVALAAPILLIAISLGQTSSCAKPLRRSRTETVRLLGGRLEPHLAGAEWPRPVTE